MIQQAWWMFHKFFTWLWSHSGHAFQKQCKSWQLNGSFDNSQFLLELASDQWSNKLCWYFAGCRVTIEITKCRNFSQWLKEETKITLSFCIVSSFLQSSAKQWDLRYAKSMSNMFLPDSTWNIDPKMSGCL